MPASGMYGSLGCSWFLDMDPWPIPNFIDMDLEFKMHIYLDPVS